MPFADTTLSPEETRKVFDEALDKARKEGKLPDFFVHALRREAVARAEIFQMLMAKLADWLVEEQALMQNVVAIGGRQATAIEDLRILFTCTGQLIEVVKDVVSRLNDLEGEVGKVTGLFGNSSQAHGTWLHAHLQEHKQILRAIRYQATLNGNRHTETVRRLDEQKEALANLSEGVGELLGRQRKGEDKITAIESKLLVHGKRGLAYGMPALVLGKLLEYLLDYLSKQPPQLP